MQTCRPLTGSIPGSKKMPGIPVWYDGLHLPAGTQIVTKLASAIDECQTMIVVLSSSAIRSNWVEKEYDHAHKSPEESVFPRYSYLH